MKRRSFLRCLGCSAAAIAASQIDLLPQFLGGVQNARAFGPTTRLSTHEARFYKKLPGGGIECGICPRHCRVPDLERGFCGTRENRGDVYRTLVYGLPCAINVDPIEKKPLFHFYPGTRALSLATAGCNVDCKFCQNWEISQSSPEQTTNYDLPPDEIPALCRTRAAASIAFTYSEPVTFYEYMYDIARLGRKHDLHPVMITGGFIEKEPLAELLPVLSAVKVDLKSIRGDYYANVVRGELKPVLEALLQIRSAGVWLEIVNLVVPTLNDSDSDFRDLARWVRTNLGADVPVHYSRFQPNYLLKNLPPTPADTLERALDISRAEGLDFVYLGNLPGHPAESTCCPGCGGKIIERRGNRTLSNKLRDGHCPDCGRVIPGRF